MDRPRARLRDPRFCRAVFRRIRPFSRRRLVFSSNTAVKEAVMSGLGVTLLSRFAARREIAHGELLARPIAGADLARSFDLVWRTGAHTPRAEALFHMPVHGRRQLTRKASKSDRASEAPPPTATPRA
ncbi:MAG: hypothetical protein IMW86_09060 [Hydrogenibacillus sp.]|nr:hypothetical protein [Hydrogenibacillus sp.]